MLSNKEIICPNNLLDVAHQKKGIKENIYPAGFLIRDLIAIIDIHNILPEILKTKTYRYNKPDRKNKSHLFTVFSRFFNSSNSPVKCFMSFFSFLISLFNRNTSLMNMKANIRARIDISGRASIRISSHSPVPFSIPSPTVSERKKGLLL